MKKLTALVLFAAFALAAPLSVYAQADNNAARIASQKRNAKLSRKEIKAQNRRMRKARQRAMSKAMKSMRKSRAASHPQTTTPPAA